ncbi:MAG TPA: EAL domain-containing protein [Rhizobiaceae bacterium]|nr:EAL domain-containing protein [Rhizobiaceae bacterium]
MASGVSSRLLTNQVTLAVLALAFFSVAMIASFGLYAMLRADQDALLTQRAFVAAGIKQQFEAIAQQQESVTVWDDSVTETKAHDDTWMAENLSVWMNSYYGHDLVYVLDEFNEPIHVMADGNVVPAAGFAGVEPAIKRLVDDLRLLMMQVAAGERTDEPKLLVQDLVSIAGQPAIASLMPIVPDSDRVTQEPGSEYLHVSVQRVDQGLIHGIAEQYRIAGMRVLSLTAETDVAASVPLIDSHGAILGYIGWDRDRPGLTFIKKIAPALIGVTVLAAGVLLFLLRRLRRASAQLERSQNETEFLAFHDTLTGLPNRALFDDRLQRAHIGAREKGGRIALLYIDLDRFKHVNDTLGHAAGDELVRQTAHRLKSAARASDTVARLGGDEFAIIMEGIRDMRAAEDLSAELLTDLAHPFELMGDLVHIGASIGIAVGPDTDTDHIELLRKADIALYEAKKKGRGRHEVFAGDMDDLIIRRRVIESDLRLALQGDDNLRLTYQPIYASDCATIVGAEALIRWDHPVHGALPPAQFIAIAEERGMMKELGDWLLNAACRFVASTKLPWVAVNVSPLQLREEDFFERLIAMVGEAGLAPSRLQVEITENVLLDTGGATRKNLARLRTAGIHVALDDFGTGYSSVNYLRRYGIDKLKVDRSFVHMLGKEDTAAPIIRAIVDLAKALKVKITIEGVESIKQRDIVLSMGVDELQGYLFSPPLRENELLELLEATEAGIARKLVPASRA